MGTYSAASYDSGKDVLIPLCNEFDFQWLSRPYGRAPDQKNIFLYKGCIEIYYHLQMVQIKIEVRVTRSRSFLRLIFPIHASLWTSNVLINGLILDLFNKTFLLLYALKHLDLKNSLRVALIALLTWPVRLLSKKFYLN